MAAHGMSVVEIERGSRPPARGAAADPRRPRHNRRHHASTPIPPRRPRRRGRAAAGPSADPTGTQVLGTLNNCAGGTTPWGTVLSGEENFNQYFDAPARSTRATPTSYERYGITGVRRPRLERRRPPLRPDAGAARAVPLRLGRRARPARTRPPRRASTRCSAASSTRAPTSPSPTTATPSPTWATTSAATTSTSSSRPRPFARPRAPRPRRHNMTLLHEGHAVRRAVHRRRHRGRRLRRHRRVDPADARDTDVVRRRDDASPTSSSSPASPPTRSAPPRWTGPRTSSPTRSTARSTPR